jgi:hypothetical protein
VFYAKRPVPISFTAALGAAKLTQEEFDVYTYYAKRWKADNPITTNPPTALKRTAPWVTCYSCSQKGHGSLLELETTSKRSDGRTSEVGGLRKRRTWRRGEEELKVAGSG